LLGVLSVVPLVAGDPEDPFLQDGVAAVPEREGQAEALADVAQSGEPVLVPAVGARAGVIVREGLPRGTARRVVLANRAPRALGEVRSPPPPHGVLGLQSSSFGVRHRVPGRAMAGNVTRRRWNGKGRA